MIRNLKLGYDLGANLQQSFGVPTATADICAQTQSALTGNAGIDRDGLGVRVRHYCLSLATAKLGGRHRLVAARFNVALSAA